MANLNLGVVTAYGYAKDNGYTGTEEQFAELMASYATVAEQAAQSATDAAGAKTDAESARDAAVEAKNLAVSAKDDAQSARDTATGAAGTATSKASEAAGYAGTASTKATAAANSATEASGYAGTATTKAGQAADSATAANTSKEAAADSAEDSEAWAVGQVNGTDVASGAAQYHNNSKYYSQQAADSATAAAASAASLTIDSATSTTSTNALQNKVITGELNDLKQDLTNITGQTYNLVIGKLSGLTVDGSGGMQNWGGTTDMQIAPVTSGTTYTIKTDDGSGFVGAFYTAIPTASTTASYNSSRVIQTSKTFTAPITGYVAFRTSNGYAYAQIVEGSADKTYIAPTTAIDLTARGDISELDTKVDAVGVHTDNLVKGKLAGYTVKSSGLIVANEQTDFWVAPIEQNKNYTVQTKGSAGIVYGLFSNNPLEDVTITTYNDSRTVPSGTIYTFTAPITGYIGFTSVNDAINVQIVEGTAPKAYITPTTTAVDVVARNNINNILEGKILCCCGDSITYGADMDADGISDDVKAVVYQSDATGDFSAVTSNYLKTWGCQIAERNRMTFYNAGVSGSTIQGLSDYNGFSLADGRYTKLPNSIDYLVLWFGWNDTAYGTLGAITDTTNDSYYGAYNVVLPYLINKYPLAKIALVVPFGCDAEHRQAVRLLANKWGVACWDNYQGGTPLYYGKETSVGVETSIVTANQAKFQANGAHPNYAGHTQLADMIENFLRGI